MTYELAMFLVPSFGVILNLVMYPRDLVVIAHEGTGRQKAIPLDVFLRMTQVRFCELLQELTVPGSERYGYTFS